MEEGKKGSYEEPISKEHRNSIKTNVCFCFTARQLPSDSAVMELKGKRKCGKLSL
jgi:hypothetical protein